jgi:hypothetical protein
LPATRCQARHSSHARVCHGCTFRGPLAPTMARRLSAASAGRIVGQVGGGIRRLSLRSPPLNSHDAPLWHFSIGQTHWAAEMSMNLAKTILKSVPLVIGLLSVGTSLASANSDTLRGTMIPASACVPFGINTDIVRAATDYGSGWRLLANGSLRLLCPFQVRDTMTSYRIHYRDPDGRSGNASVKVSLDERQILPSGTLSHSASRCSFASNKQGTPTTYFARVTIPCTKKLVPGRFYDFVVELWQRKGVSETYLIGIDLE